MRQVSACPLFVIAWKIPKEIDGTYIPKPNQDAT
jgi:hypothetical protein